MTGFGTHEIARHWTAGESGCGTLIEGLSGQLRNIRSGELLNVTALNAGARADLPTWCRVTSHSLVTSDHPVYVLSMKGD
jgi:TusA-related sulfurtransferase